MTVTTQADHADAETAYRDAGQAFRETVRNGGHGAAEYAAWREARAAYIMALDRLSDQRRDVRQARLDEYWHLRKETSRISGIAEQTGGKWYGLPAARAEWLRRASAFAGREITEIDMAAIHDPGPASSGPPVDVPRIPDHGTAVAQVLSGG